MRKILLPMALACLLGAVSPAAGADLKASVAKVTGKCQLLQGAEWVALTLGQELSAGATVSTGFRSELQLKIGPSILTVKALSRLSITDLVQTGSDLKTDLYLKVGKIEAQVNKDDSVKTNKMTVGSPVSTASVRGTEFAFDGLNLLVTRGQVDFSDLRGHRIPVAVGEAAKVVDAGQGMVSSQQMARQNATVQVSASASFGATSESASYGGGQGAGDYSDVLDTLDDYDWSSELPWVFVSVGGIIPSPEPTATQIAIGGIIPTPTPVTTQIPIGGIQ